MATNVKGARGLCLVLPLVVPLVVPLMLPVVLVLLVLALVVVWCPLVARLASPREERTSLTTQTAAAATARKRGGQEGREREERTRLLLWEPKTAMVIVVNRGGRCGWSCTTTNRGHSRIRQYGRSRHSQA